MAKKKMPNPGKIKDELLAIQSADSRGVTPEFSKKNRRLIEETINIMDQKLSANGSVKGNFNNSPNAEFARILSGEFREDEKVKLADDIDSKVLQQSASYFIDDNDIEDLEVIDSISEKFKDCFSSMTEYEYMVDLIPELRKIFDMFTADIISPDDFSNKIIKNVYKPTSASSVDTESISKANDAIIGLLDTYKFEEKLEKWVGTALIKGAKPVAIFPSSEILKASAKYAKKKAGSEISYESVIEGIYEEISTESETYYKPRPLSRVSGYRKSLMDNSISTESFEEGGEYFKDSKEINSYFDDIIDDEMRTSYESICMEGLKQTNRNLKLNVIGKDLNEAQALQQSLESFGISLNKESDEKRVTGLDFNLKQLIESIDDRINVVKDDKVPFVLSSKHMKATKDGADREPESIHNFLSNNNPYSDKKSRTIKIGDVDVPVEGSFSDEDIDKMQISKRPVIIEYDPEDVIPITNGSSHIGYYVIERLGDESDIFGKKRRNSGSFTSLVKSLTGDEEMVKGNSFYGTAGAGSPYISNTFSPESFMNLGTMSMNARSLVNGKQKSGGTSGDSLEERRMNLLKKIVVKTLAKRLGNMDYAKDATFQNNILNILRKDLIIKNDIRFSFVHPSHMCYFHNELDDEGMPVSRLKGTLFNGYMLIGSRASSYMIKMMRSENSESLHINMGAMKNIGVTIKEVQKFMSTRNISAGSMFGGVASALKTASSFRRNIIPEFDGNQIYSVETDDRNKDISPDDEFTEKNLQSIVLRIGAPLSSLNLLEDNEYSRSVAYNRMDYRNIIIGAQKRFGRTTEKAIKLLAFYGLSNIETNESANEKKVKDSSKTNKKDVSIIEEFKINIDDIEFTYPSPKGIGMDTISESISASNDTADALAILIYGEDEPEDAAKKMEIQIFKRKIVQSFVNNVNWSDIENIREQAHTESFNKTLEDSKTGAAEEDDGY